MISEQDLKDLRNEIMLANDEELQALKQEVDKELEIRSLETR